MPIPDHEKVPPIERLRDVFEADATRLLLSALIILSVLPLPWVDRLSLGFFAIFAAELGLRVVLLRHELRQRRLNRTEIIVLALDVVATLSFLPLEGLFGVLEVRYLRLIRLSRMLMLLSYWSPVGKEIWVILSKRERRYQLFFVAALVVLLTFTAGILLYNVDPTSIDFDEDGKLRDPGFWTTVWWSFRQLQDPGNLVKTPSATVAFVFSLLLTIFGIFVIAFLIGIGASVVRELVEVGRERRLGLRNHSLIVNLGPHSRVLVEELVAYYAKSFRSARLVTMGHAPARYDYMYADSLRSVRYRRGSGSTEHDLRKVDGDRARRVILLGEGEHNLADSEVIGQILMTRRVNANCRIFAELVRPDNMRAALMAGGANTVPVLAHRLVSLLLADILAFPGVERVYAQLLSSRGSEIYTCYFDVGLMSGELAPDTSLGDFGELCRRAHADHGVLMLGHALGDPSMQPEHVLVPTADTVLPTRNADRNADSLAGLFALAPNFERLGACVRTLPHGRPAAEPLPLPAGLRLAPERHPLNKLLICGFHEGLVDLCEQLALFCPGIAIVLLVPTAEHAQRLERELLARGDHAPTSDAAAPRIEVERRRPAVLTYRARTRADRTEDEATDAVRGEIRLFAADWSEGQELLADRDGFRFAEMEAVLLTYTSSDSDPDGRTALALLKLLHLREARPDLLHPDLRLVCEVLDSERAALFERRFVAGSDAADGPSAADTNLQLVVVSAEHLRHALLAQAVFVPGIDSIYTQLLGFGGPELCKLVPAAAWPDQTIDFGQLVCFLHRRTRLLPIAVELKSASPSGPDGERRANQIHVNPAPADAGYRFPANDLVAIYAIGPAPRGPLEISPDAPATEAEGSAE